MHEKQVTFVAFQEQDNLGVGYLGAVLMQAGFKIGIIDFRTEKEVILNKLLADMPLAVGFSIIFQYHIQEFKDLIQYLRSNGVIVISPPVVITLAYGIMNSYNSCQV